MLTGLAIVAVVATVPLQAQVSEPVPLPGRTVLPNPQYHESTDELFLDQPVELTGCTYSAGNIGQICGENFLVPGTAPILIDQVVTWAIYHPQGAPPAGNNPKIRFWSDAGGIPGTVLSEETSVPAAIVDTGLDDGRWGLDVYMLTMTLNQPIELDPGTYWIDITEETGDFSNQFCWEFGLVDPTNGIPGSAIAFNDPPNDAWLNSNEERSLQLSGTVIPVELEAFEIER